MIRMIIGNKLRKFAEWIMPKYWCCIHCGNIKYKAEEVSCWKCGIGEMVYKGEINGRSTTIQKWNVDRWRRQINTNYTDLSEKEKESDRKEADKFI